MAYRPDINAKGFRYGHVGISLCQQAQDFQFPAGELSQQRGPLSLGKQRNGERRVKNNMPFTNRRNNPAQPVYPFQLLL